MIIDKEIIDSLGKSFPQGFINTYGEFIAYPRTNLYFNLATCENLLDIKCKVLEWFSRDASKAIPFRSDWRNEEYQSTIRNGINDFLGTNFSSEEMLTIYCALGNRINHDLTVKFVNSGYDMAVLEVEE